MHTTLYTILDDARRWAKDQSGVLSLSLTPQGLLVKGFTPSDSKQWILDAGQVVRGFASDPPLLGSTPSSDPLGLRMQSVFGGPLGVLRLATSLLDDTDGLTQAIVARAALDRVAADVDPWVGLVPPAPTHSTSNVFDLLKSPLVFGA